MNDFAAFEVFVRTALPSPTVDGILNFLVRSTDSLRWYCTGLEVRFSAEDIA